MKKVLSFTLALILSFLFFSCAKNNEASILLTKAQEVIETDPMDLC